jgi:hypothetical protein
LKFKKYSPLLVHSFLIRVSDREKASAVDFNYYSEYSTRHNSEFKQAPSSKRVKIHHHHNNWHNNHNKMKSTSSYQETCNTASMSLLSLTLSGKIGYKSSRIPSSMPSHIRAIDRYADSDRTEPAAEPPLKLNADTQCSRIPLKDGALPRSTVHVSRNIIRTFSESSKTQLGASPMTSCSYRTMSKEYDMDTWRMYNRIQEARSQKSEPCFHSPESQDDNEQDKTPEEIYFVQPTNRMELGYAEEIFDLEL